MIHTGDVIVPHSVLEDLIMLLLWVELRLRLDDAYTPCQQARLDRLDSVFAYRP